MTVGFAPSWVFAEAVIGEEKHECSTRRLFEQCSERPPRVKLDLATYYRHYDYPNAFAFHNPIAGIRSLETIRSKLRAEYRITPHFSINARAEYRDSASSDTRINYDQTWFQVGVTWRL